MTTLFLDERLDCLLRLQANDPNSVFVWTPIEGPPNEEEPGPGILRLPKVENSHQGGVIQAQQLASILIGLDGQVQVSIVSDGLETIQESGCMKRICPYVSDEYSSYDLLVARARILSSLRQVVSYKHFSCN